MGLALAGSTLFPMAYIQLAAKEWGEGGVLTFMIYSIEEKIY